MAALLNSHEDKVLKLREKYEEKKKRALTDLEKSLLAEREEKYKQAIAAPDIPDIYFIIRICLSVRASVCLSNLSFQLNLMRRSI